MNGNQIIYTNEAKCQDCYRCVRVCPVKAIAMKNGQAQVKSERCIVCGTCIRECPQKAKTYRHDVEKVKRLLENNDTVYAMVAPSYYSIYNTWERKRIPSVLRKLGFKKIYEVSEAAYTVADETINYFDKCNSGGCIAGSCPVVVNYIEKYQKDLADKIAPVASPFIVEARGIKQTNDEFRIVFIGPCIAKKAEAERSENIGLIDAVITFNELNDWIKQENIEIKEFEESSFNKLINSLSPSFPLVGGLIKTLNNDRIKEDSVFSISGKDELFSTIEDIKVIKEKILIDALFCQSGCINGPGINSSVPVSSRKLEMKKYGEEAAGNEVESIRIKTETSAVISKNKSVYQHGYSDEEIKAVLEKTGKAEKEDQLNCGACGYDTCRDKAIAVLNGMAENEMCMPYVKRIAQQRTDKIIESSPNGIVILDEHLKILHMNPAFRKFFMCTNSIAGKNISYLMDPELFIQLKEGDQERIEKTVRYENYNLICHQLFYKMPAENQLVGVFVNITKNMADSDKLDELKQQTIFQAQELLNHQIEMAQKIAKYLGESAAKGEELVENLMRFSEDKTKKRNSSEWLWDIYTSK